MVKQFINRYHFSYGELSPNLFGRTDVDAYKAAAMNLTNMDIIPTGGIERRDGLLFIDKLPSVGKIISFEFSSSEIFLLFFGENIIYVYNNENKKIAELNSPYTIENLKKLSFSQKGSELYLVNPDVKPQIIKFHNLKNEWEIFDWVFDKHEENNYSCEPYNRFDDTVGISLKASSLSGNTVLTASDDLFDESFVGITIFTNGGEILIDSINSTTVAHGTIVTNLSSTNVDENWSEQVFSKKRGYPNSITFHQNRLVIGGSKSLVNRLWISKTGRYMDFDLGTALDDEAIEFDIFSDKVNEIVSVFSGKHLQIFSSDAEWMVTGVPLTPSNISVTQQTKIGSVSERFIAPKLVESSTFFVAKNKKEIREFFYGDLSESYSSQDLILLSSHLLNNPIQQDYNIKKRVLYVIQDDGSMAVLFVNKTNDLNAWVKYETDGKFISLAVVDDKVFVLTERFNEYFLETFDDEIYADCSVKLNLEEETDIVSGLEHLEGKDVEVNADNYLYSLKVENGIINLPKKSKNIVIGIAYQHLFCPLPVFGSSGYIPSAVRLLDVTLRVVDTPLVQIDTGKGLRNITVLNFDSGVNFDDPVPSYTGDLNIRGKGFIRNYETPLFKIQSLKPSKVKILNISTIVDVVK